MPKTFLILLLSAAIASSIICAPTNDIDSKAAPLNYRLPTSVLPQNYVVELTPYFTGENGKEQFTFDGKVEITLSTNETNISDITLHTNELDVSGTIKLRELFSPMTEIRVMSRSYDIRTHKYTLGLEKTLSKGVQYVLSMQYVGKLGTDMYGFYRSSYVENGKTVWLATTQMQPTHARRVFPCFDEPRFKATFVIKINRPSHFEPTVGNTKIESTELNAGPGLVRETFYHTPIMSTYLVAFIVSEFKSRENVQKTFNVYARPKAFAQTEFSFNIGQKLLSKFDELFDYKYSSVPEMTKMSMAAIPDFSAGAMENWGLLTYRETALLYDPNASTASAQQRVAEVVAHEQAHMWFGDLVTCDWWKYTWLNEGFARYFQYFGTNLVEPTWELGLQFVTVQLQYILGIDSLESTHPMTYDVNTPEEVSSIFDGISYGKGASVIRMIEHVIGREKLINGLREYLKQNAFQTAVPETLFGALQKYAGNDIDIASVMGSWTTQSGYPVVTIDVQDNRKDIKITQKRFLLHNKYHTDPTKWDIPLNYATAEDNANFASTHNQFLLSQQTEKKSFLYEIDWIVFNIQQTGFYRVNYDETTWKNLAKALQKSPKNIHALNRAQIVDDSLNLARADLLNYTTALNTIQYLEGETHYSPWAAAFNNFPYILNRFEASDSVIFKNHILRLLENVYNYLGFEPKASDTRLDIYNRINVLGTACHLGHKECIAKAKIEFIKFQSTNYKIPVNIVPVVYCTVVAEEPDYEWDFLWKKYITENVAAEKMVILTALGCTKSADTLKKYLDLIATDSVRLQDKTSAYYSTLKHKENIDSVFDYVNENHSKITQSTGSKSAVTNLLVQLSGRFSSKQQIEKLKRFVEANKAEYGASKSISNALINAEFNLKWAAKNIPTIKHYLKNQTEPTKGDGNAASGIAASTCLVILACISYFIA